MSDARCCACSIQPAIEQQRIEEKIDGRGETGMLRENQNANRLAITLLTGALLLPSVASAQTYVTGRFAAPYQPIGTITGIGGVTSVPLVDEFGIPDADEGYGSPITIPFTFNFLGVDYTQLGISSNGWLGLGGQVRDSDLSNDPIPTTATPNEMIALFWDDLDYATSSTGTIGLAPNRIFVVELDAWAAYFGNPSDDGQVQIWFYENQPGTFEVRYGGTLASSFASTAGYEGVNAAPSGGFMTCGAAGTCTATDYNADFANYGFRVGPAQAPELTGDIGPFPRGAFPGNSANGVLEFTNHGVDTATDSVNNLYLSTDMTLDASDLLVGTATITIPGGSSTATVAVTAQIPAGTATGDYYMILEVDAPNTFTEVDESDNVILGSQMFATGYEMEPTGIVMTSPLNGANPGQTVTFDVEVTNNGVPRVGDLEIALFASADGIFDVNDAPIDTVTVTLQGLNTETVQASGILPTLTPGPYFAVAQLDPNNLLDEANETNNTFVAATPFSSGSDFRFSDLTVPAQVIPGGTVQITTTIDSMAVPYVGNVPYELWSSLDQTLDATDLLLGSFTVPFAGEDDIPDTRDVTFDISMDPASYYIIAVLDPQNTIVEVDEQNNERVSSGTILNAYDFAVSNVNITPTTIENHDDVTVTGTIRSIGVAFTGHIPYRIIFSADSVLDPGDDVVNDGTIFIAGLSSAPLDVTFPLTTATPLPPGNYNVIVEVDPDDLYLEAVETNNHAVGNDVDVQGADLIVDSVTAPSFAFIGRQIQVEVTVENSGIASASGFRYAYYLSENNIIRVTDQQIFVSDTATIASGSQQTYVDMVNLPTFTSTQTMWIGVIVDIFSQVPETSESNNIRRVQNPIDIVFPIPDLTATVIEIPPFAAAGEEFAITRILQNEGVADAPSFEFTYYLSNNPTISGDDYAIGTFSMGLAELEDDFSIDVVVLPSTIPEDDYYIGIVVDPDELVTEIDDTNNTAIGPEIPVYGAAIQFLTDDLPNATIGVPYEVGIYASGGPIATTWAISAGALPNGLSIDANSGIISGTSTEEGLFEFTIRALSGTAYADKLFDLRVTAPTVQLRIATPSLPSAIAGREYSTSLIAVGGTEPYDWAAISTLPRGLSLSQEGLLSGTPETPGNLPLTVRVRDDVGNSASRELVLSVINANQSVQITQIPLPTAIVGLEFCDPTPIVLEARNGLEPYRWTIVGDVPPGMHLSLGGELCGTPERAGSFEIVIRAQDQTGLFDTSLQILEVDDGTDLAISTFSLDPGKTEEAYEAILTVIKGDPPYTWSIVNDWSTMPPGLSLSDSGVLSGTPLEAGVYAFVVQVTDGKLRVAIQPLSLAITKKQVTSSTDDGCSCNNTVTKSSGFDWYSMLGIAFVGILLAVRRRRRRIVRSLLPLAFGLMVVGFGARAEAQLIPGTPYQKTVEPVSYTDLPSPTVIWTDTDDSTSSIPVPFPFKFYDQTHTQVTVGSNGCIAMGSVSSITLSNQTPGSSTLDGFIAPVWDDLRLFSANAGSVGYQVQGVAPQRTFTIEFKKISRYSVTGTQMSFQVRLFEGDAARFEVDYGPSSGTPTLTATMGMEDQSGGRPILFASSQCTTTCTYTDYQSLQGSRIILVQDPGIELVASSVDGPALAFLGAETPVSVTVSNLHGAPIGPFTVSTFVAAQANMIGAIEAGSTVMSLSSFQSVTTPITSVPPISFGEGEFYWGVEVDSNNVIAEVNENNNTAADPEPVRLIRGKPDLTISSVVPGQTEIQAGSSAQVVTITRNAGGEPAASTPVALMLSSNPVISPQDVELDRYNVTLGAAQTDTTTRTITIPSGTNSGAYYIGALTDPEGILEELSESNNGVASEDMITISGGNLAVTTTALPTGYVSITYVALLTAAGGDSNYDWVITQGNLPDGLGLVEATGEIYGRPMREETQNITVEVTSAGQSDTASLSIHVSDPAEPLTVVTRGVPPAVVGQEYVFHMAATGGTGTSSLSWTATGLPDGIDITHDGVLAGTPSIASTATVAVSVTDGNETANRGITMDVRDNANLLIVPRMLSTATFNEAYSEQLTHSGGIEPITWIKQLGELPEGMELSTSGAISGTPTEVGVFRFVVEARDSGIGGLNAKDVNTFELTVADIAGFSITTTSLPDAVVGQGYDESVAADGGQPPYEWTIEEGRLPDGLLASINPNTNEFRIAGQPSGEGVSNLLLKVVDSNGREAQRALALRVFITLPTTNNNSSSGSDDDGCSCTTEGTPRGGLTVLWVFLGLFALSRRR